MANDKRDKKDTEVRFVKWFKHYRTGKIIYAADYGLQGFPIGKGKK